MRLPDSPSDELGDDLIFDPVLERKRITDGTEEYLEELRRDWEKYASGKNSFPEKISKISSALREWMLSFDRTSFYDRLAREFDLQASDRMGLARLAWDIILQSEWSPRAELFEKYIGNASVISELGKRFAADFIPKARELSLIADARPNASSPSISRSVSTERKTIDRVEISLMQALGKFEKLGGQQVTNSKIVVKGQNDPVRPTIFNWLRAYRDELGVGAHDAVTRGQFLFHSLNGKGLSADERDQVGLLLKSLDENMPLTIDAGRQEVIFSESRIKNQESLPDRQAGRMESKPLPALPLERGGGVGGGQGNISRAVFELPVMKNEESRMRNQEFHPSPAQTRELPLERGAGSMSSAFEQAKTIQEANRESRLSISNIASETVELGRMTAPREEIRPVAPPRPPIASAVQNAAPAPRAISFEPAKIDNFSFGAGDQKTFSNSGRTPQTGERPLSTRTEDFRPNFAPRDDMNVSALSFSTNHVMPAEKESINRQQLTDNREQSMERDSNSGLRQPSESAVREENAKPLPTLPLERGGGVNGGVTALPVSMPVQKTAAPANRYRITPTGHRDTVASDDTPSPHVVDLRS